MTMGAGEQRNSKRKKILSLQHQESEWYHDTIEGHERKYSNTDPYRDSFNLIKSHVTVAAYLLQMMT